MSKILYGRPASEEKLNILKKKMEKFKTKPNLAVIQIGDNSASNIYIKNKEKMCNELKIGFKHIKYNDVISELEIINEIEKLNKSKEVTGILLQLPIPKTLNEDRIINAINPIKDVDGLTKENLGKLFTNEGIISCTPEGIIYLLNYYKIKISGKKVVIIGRSNLVGKPLMHLFLKENATVTICHSKTKDLKKDTLTADILVAAAGKPHLIKADMVGKNTIIIDVGVNRIDNKIIGDVDPKVYEKVKAYTPPIGGVGVLTITSLMSNIVKCYQLQHFD